MLHNATPEQLVYDHSSKGNEAATRTRQITAKTLTDDKNSKNTDDRNEDCNIKLDNT